ncbi:GIY-YIG catalytic domain containing protein [Tritrichomonas foetus]|uniref:Structure-specific endonuclease subunit SLX1 homolog n=1 Tax=Tritrichomonas foetus TaxID=1144522 RepID=A0A1J4JTS7_9EUKA|nr:GIY-YIG catalytic domain containing protein [Tritrichomonas foetus]|eukprot:OHT01848.1 GIY-YIG catalytic domain containing protein [Tritrichomonas foetus]
MQSSFAGCYLLRSKNPSYREACYVGFTVNPTRRLRQHNGDRSGGAYKTHAKRPWEMTIVVYGFPTRKQALKFEWCWQHPTQSTRLKEIHWHEVFQQTGGPTKYKSHIRILKEMLNIPPWNRLDLLICVTCPDVLDLLNTEPKIDPHHTVKLGRLEDIPIETQLIPTPSEKNHPTCLICHNDHESIGEKLNWIVCPFCSTFFHLRCLARRFIEKTSNSTSTLIPTEGTCPTCNEKLLWRNVVELRNQISDKDSLLHLANDK